MSSTETPNKPAAKPVPWVELYFDLVVVFAVKQLSEGIAHHPTWANFAFGFGLFLILWWSWIGFTLIYNRWGNADRAVDIWLMIAATLPMTLIAIGFAQAFESNFTYMFIGLALSRLLLGTMNFMAYRYNHNIWVGRIGATYYVSAVIFAACIFIQHQITLAVLCAIAIGLESAAVLTRYRSTEDALNRLNGRKTHHGPKNSPRDARHKPKRERPQNLDAARALSAKEGVSLEILTVNPAHLAERFQLFLIIILGEIIVATATGATNFESEPWAFAMDLVSGLAIAGCLGWMYFNRTAETNEHAVLSAQGTAAVARDLYARGLILPAFGLLLVAAGLEASLGEHAEAGSLLPLAIGTTLFLLGIMRFNIRTNMSARLARFASILAILGCTGFAVLDRLHIIGGGVGVAIIAAWLGIWTLTGTLMSNRTIRARG